MKLKSITFVALLLFSLFIIEGCSTTKFIPDNEYLLKESNIYIDGKKNKDPNINNYVIQRPNQKILGFPLGLQLYNLGQINNTNYFQKKIDSIELRDSFLDKILSKKQSYNGIKGKHDLQKWFIENGEAPVIIDLKKQDRTAKNLKAYFFNQGYFQAKVKSETRYDVKKAIQNYFITKGTPTLIDSVSYHIESAAVDSVLKIINKKHLIVKSQQYNSSLLNQKADYITKKLRNNGFYKFNKGLISFRQIDTLAKDHKTALKIHIENPVTKVNEKTYTTPLAIQRIKSVKVYTDYSYKNRNLKYDYNEQLKGYDFYAHKKLKHNSKTLARSIFIKPGDAYSDKSAQATREHLRSLNNFKLVKINQTELDNDELATTILLTPLPKYNIGFNTELIHSNIKELGLSGGINIKNRNLFKGAEILQFSVQGSVFNTATQVNNTNNSFFNAWELGADASLEIPRFLFPILPKILPIATTPKTKFAIGTSLQKNIGLDRRIYTGSVNYKWKSSQKNKHVFELLNAQFINNTNPESYFNIYSSEFNKVKRVQTSVNPSFNLTPQNALNFIANGLPSDFRNTNPNDFTTLRNIQNRNKIITANNLIPSTSYSFEHNSKRGLADRKYNFFRIKLTSAGNFSRLFLKKDEINNTPISKFIKLDIDSRSFLNIGRNSTLAFRFFGGIAVPTTKNGDIPFTHSYFAGGSNDIRAWRAYELGPGRSNSGLEFNIGNIKLLSSLEYRFKILNSIYGAAFIDAGNIWNLDNNTTSTREENLSSFNDLRNTAIGTGFGLRYDFNFVVVRLDLGIKTYEPYLIGDKWLQNYSLKESVFNIGINYPF